MDSVSASSSSRTNSRTIMMDHTGTWILPMNDSNNNNISDDDDASMMMHQPMVTVITSPGVPSQLLKNIEQDGDGDGNGNDDHDDRPPLCLVETQEEDHHHHHHYY